MKITMFIYLLIALLIIGCNKNDGNGNVIAPLNDGKVYDSLNGEFNLNGQSFKLSIIRDSLGNANVLGISDTSMAQFYSAGQELWLNFPVTKGELYEISWKAGNWWPGYNAGIYVTAFEEDRSTLYFKESWIMQMNGSPKAISIGKTGKVLIRVKDFLGTVPGNQFNNTSGKFAFFVKKLDVNLAEEMPFDSILAYKIQVGGLKLCKFNVVKDSQYTVVLDGSKYVGAVGDEVAVSATAFRENLKESYFSEQYVGSSALAGANVINFKALATETVYLTFIGAYWFYPRDIFITIKK